jgi:hypothetical protein
MIRGLLGKELRQHGFSLGFLLVLPFAGLILISNFGLLRRAGGAGFEAVRLLLYLFLPLACLVLGQLLIASEFRQKTQLFLEGLPLPRWRMLAVKFGLGLVLVLLTSILALAYVGWNARHTEAMTPRFAALLLSKSAAWAVFVYSLCFAHAFLGRYRLPFGVALVTGIAYCKGQNLPVTEFGPFALIDNRFAFERFVWPVEALAITGGLLLLFAALGFFLGLVRDATVAAMLAEKMSAREKVFLTLLTFVVLMVMGERLEHQKSSTPVQMPGAAEARHGPVQVLASAAVDAPSREETATLQRTANHVAAELGALADYLGCDSFPPIFIVHRRDLTAKDLLDGELKPEQGVLVRTNLLAPGFKPEALDAWLLRQTLNAHTHGIAGRERNVWVLEGLVWWWPRSKHGQVSAWDEALGAERERDSAPGANVTPAQLHAWLTLLKSRSVKSADVFAGSGLALIAERHGTAGLRRFLSDRYAQAQPADARAWWRDWLRPTSTRLRAATGLSEDAFTAEWRNAMATKP